MCNDRKVPVTASLFSALYFLRDEVEERFLWCDAVCINQNDPVEKARQVANMLQIYEKASHVVGWLGPPSKASSVLFAALQEGAEFLPKLQTSQDVTHTEDCHHAFNEFKHGLSEVVTAPWCFRTWVRQEVYAAKKVALQRGFLQIDFQQVIDILSLELDLERTSLRSIQGKFYFTTAQDTSARDSGLQRLHGSQNSAPSKTDRKRTTLMTYSDEYQHRGTERHGYQSPSRRQRLTNHWLSTLFAGSAFDVTDDRDRIYGALGILRSRSTRLYVEDLERFYTRNFPINYEKSVSEVYQDVVKFLINVDQNLDVLQIYDSNDPENSEFPSWTPDFRLKTLRSILEGPPNRREEAELWGTPFQQTLTDTPRDGPLKLKGCQVGRLTLLDAMTKALPPEDSKYGGQKSNEPVTSGLDDNLDKLVASGAYILARFSDNKHIVPDLIKDFPYRALVPRHARIDDIVVALEGCESLFLVRKVHESKGSGYILVGPIGLRIDPDRQGYTSVAGSIIEGVTNRNLRNEAGFTQAFNQWAAEFSKRRKEATGHVFELY